MNTQNKNVTIKIICDRTGSFGSYVPANGTAKIIHLYFNMGNNLFVLENLRRMYRELETGFSYMEPGHIQDTETGFVTTILPDPNGCESYQAWQRDFIARDMRLIFFRIQKIISSDDFLNLMEEFIKELLSIDWDDLLKQKILAAMSSFLVSYPEDTVKELRLFLESFNL